MHKVDYDNLPPGVKTLTPRKQFYKAHQINSTTLAVYAGGSRVVYERQNGVWVAASLTRIAKHAEADQAT